MDWLVPVLMNGCKSWAIKKAAWKNSCFLAVVSEETFEHSLDYKEVQQIHPKGNQSWIFIGRADAEAEAPILWSPDANNWLIGKDWFCQRLKAGGEGDDRGWDGWMASLTQWTWVWASSRSWWWTGKPDMLQSMGCRESDMTEWLNWYICIHTHIYTYNGISPSHKKEKKFCRMQWCGHLGCSQVLAIVNRASMSTMLHISFQILGFLQMTCLWMELLVLIIALLLVFKELPYCSL